MLCFVLLCINTFRPRQNGRHFADDIFKCIFWNENVWISFKISMKFIRKGLINNNPALVQIMAWCRPGDKPWSESMTGSWRIYVSLGVNELTALGGPMWCIHSYSSGLNHWHWDNCPSASKVTIDNIKKLCGILSQLKQPITTMCELCWCLVLYISNTMAHIMRYDNKG